MVKKNKILYERVRERDKRIFVNADQSQEREIEKEMTSVRGKKGEDENDEHKWLLFFST